MDNNADDSALTPERPPKNAGETAGGNAEKTVAGSGAGKALPAAAERALAEAAARRASADAAAKGLPAEEGGRGGPDPARYGDWEINGRAVDF